MVVIVLKADDGSLRDHIFFTTEQPKIVHEKVYKKSWGIRYEARSCGRSSPIISASVTINFLA